MPMKFPAMPLATWQPTRDTIQRYAQLLGEIRAASTPRSKHWWHINLRPGVAGLVTPPIPVRDSSDSFAFQMQLDFVNHRLTINSSSGQESHIPLSGQSVADLSRESLAALLQMGIRVQLNMDQALDESPGEYDAVAAATFWQALGQIAGVFAEFKAELREETSPINLWPHHFDMALVWFSGKRVAGVDPGDEDHADEQMSFGFSTGDAAIPDPYFYISAYPLPDGLRNSSLPQDATWNTQGWQGALMMYDVLTRAQEPQEKLRGYLRGVHQAGKRLMLQANN